MSTTTIDESLPARERLLAAADALFYREGVNTVGIDRVIERAGVAKATLYSAFGSKDELIRAYLLRRHDIRRERIESGIVRYSSPREKLLGVFDILAETYASPTYHGCPFIAASVETKTGTAVEAVVTAVRAWTRSLFTDLARQAGVKRPDQLAQQLHALYDGANVGAMLDHDPKTALAAKRAAEALLDAALDT